MYCASNAQAVRVVGLKRGQRSLQLVLLRPSGTSSPILSVSLQQLKFQARALYKEVCRFSLVLVLGDCLWSRGATCPSPKALHTLSKLT